MGWRTRETELRGQIEKISVRLTPTMSTVK